MGYRCTTRSAEKALAEAKGDSAEARKQASELNIYNRAKKILICSKSVESHGLKVFWSVNGGITVMEGDIVKYHGHGRSPNKTTKFHYGAWIYALDDMAIAQEKKGDRAAAANHRLWYAVRRERKSFTPKKG